MARTVILILMLVVGIGGAFYIQAMQAEDRAKWMAQREADEEKRQKEAEALLEAEISTFEYIKLQSEIHKYYSEHKGLKDFVNERLTSDDKITKREYKEIQEEIENVEQVRKDEEKQQTKDELREVLK